MRKIFLFVLSFLLLSSVVFAQEEPTLFDVMQNFDDYSKYDAKPATSDKEVEQALEDVKNRHKSKKKMKKEKENRGVVTSEQSLGGIIKKPYLLLQLPVDIYSQGYIVKKGFYKVVYSEKDDSIILKQGYRNVAKIPMRKAIKEPNKDELYYIESSQANGYLKIIYGAFDKHLENHFQIVY